MKKYFLIFTFIILLVSCKTTITTTGKGKYKQTQKTRKFL